MAKSLVRNVIGGRTFGFITSGDAAATKAFCDTNLEGTYAIYEVTSKAGNDVEAMVNLVTVTGKAKDGRKTTFSFYAKSNLSEDELRAGLLNVTFDGVKFEEVYIIHMQQIKIGEESPQP